jgi:predicted dinucleotide-binding enzyme
MGRVVMNIGMLGSGIVGRVLASGLLKHGYEVKLGSRDPKKADVQDWLRANSKGTAGTFKEAAAFGDLVVLATLGQAAENAIELAGPENLAGKTVMDTTNPIAGDAPVEGVLPFTTGPNESLAERIQAKIPKANVVKAFNSVGNALMVNPRFEQGKPTMFLCGNSAAAKAQVTTIIEQFGWEPFDCGGIIAARALEPLCMLWCIPGFLRGQWTHAFKVLTR